MTLLLTNARIFDGVNEECAEGMSVLIDGSHIREVSEKEIRAPDAQLIDVGGKTLMPGLIDLHTHAYTADVDLTQLEKVGTPYNALHAGRMLRHGLHCGFTTMRDIGGGDWSLAKALKDKIIEGPRFFYAGKILSMTGGHGDFRDMHDSEHEFGACSCSVVGTMSVIADGIDGCIKAAREELRRGAHCIKIMGSGGVTSPLDPIWMNQYRDDEIRAIVRECEERRTYVSSHCHPASGVRRSVEAGVRVIEHGTLMDAETAAFVAGKGAYVVPTLAIIFALMEGGSAMGISPVVMDKLKVAHKSAIEGLDHMRSANVKLGLGTDLLGELYDQQCREFTLRREVFEPIEILRQATSMGAEILMHEGRLGCVKPDAFADLIVVDGDPLKDIGLLSQNGERLDLIIRDGEIIKNRL